jgi:hypothetical protein
MWAVLEEKGLRILVGNPEGKKRLEDAELDGKIVVNLPQKKLSGRGVIDLAQDRGK